MNLTGNGKWVAGLATLALAVVCFEPAVQAQSTAQPAQGAGQGSGEPARAVRLSYVDGQVQLSQGNQVLAQQAVINTALFQGMQLTTADTGKAEIQFEDGSVARLSPNSSLTLSVLSGAGPSANAELTVNSGLAYFEFQGSGQSGQMSVHFAGNVVTTSGFTVLRVIMDNPPGNVAVFSGNAHIEGGDGALFVDLHGGESVALNATNPSNYDLAESIEPNSWDEFNSDRDQALTTEASTETGESANLGQSQNPAWSDLDANGSWYDVPGQGQIWSPYDASNPGFDPYGYGNWTYSPGFGYTWASGYSWGYMPFQCGAWNFYDGFGWGWAPGMGGCSPWWGLGLYGGPNIGFFPPGYRPVRRPISPPRPIGGHPVPLVAVNRHYTFASTAFPVRNANTPVRIGEATVTAVRPLPSREVYAREAFVAGANRASPANQGSRPSYVSSRPTAGGSGQPAPAYRAPQTAPANRSSSSSANHSSGSSPHSSGGYSGGGGASHPSGGGGGGGASHSSGSGGGGGGGHSGGGHGR